MIIQFCGLSGSGKTTLAKNVKEYFIKKGVCIEILDGDEYRKFLSPELGFSKEDRIKNIRRLAFLAERFSKHNIIAIICAINPYDKIRREVAEQSFNVKTIYIKCNLRELVRRDTKGIYAKALLPDSDPHKITNLSGVNDPFEIPDNPDLLIETDKESITESTQKLIRFIELNNNFY
jgi:adenylylsulfate kinase